MSYSYEWGVQRQIFFAPPPGAEGRGQKIKYHLISITKSISRFLYQTLCVFSRMKDTKHIRWDFYSVALVMPQGWDNFFFKHGHVAYQIDGDDEQNRMQVKFSS